MEVDRPLRRIPGLVVARLPVPPTALLLIAVGGMLGTLIRYELGTAYPPDPGTWPWTTFWINIVGSGVLGALLEGLAVTGPDDGWRRRVRLGVGTGMLGGFTTYSAFSVEIWSLARDGVGLVSLAYALASVVVGVCFAFAAAWGVRQLARVERPIRGSGGER